MTATETPAAPVEAPRSRSWAHMPGLDGVRAIAVLAVVVFHMDETWLPGGFLGVDVFFTLSGFLITSLLLAELAERGTISFKGFYLRRARRLLPALFLVLIATSVLAMTVAQDAAQRVKEDAIAAFFYVTNWWYVVHGTSYFEATGRPPMLQHLWSLAVEEQFYFVWPVLCLLLWRLGRTRGVRVGAALGALGSTALMAWFAVTRDMPEAVDPSRVYFGADTHAMTLLVGAVLATVWVPGRLALTGRGRRAVSAAGFLGLAGLGAIFWFVSSDTPALYRGGFLVVGLVTAVVVAGAAATGTVFARVLAVAPMRWIGERSYGIYLWHWPVFMVLRPGIDLDADGLGVQALRLAITFAVAELSYRFVEMPVRRGAVGRAWAAWKARGGIAYVGRAALAVVTSVALVVALGLGLARPQEPTLEDVLGGVDGIGDEALTPTASASPVSGPTSSPGPGASTPPAPPPGPPVLAAGQDAFGLPITVVGDSVLLAAADAIEQTFPKVVVDAKVSRQADEVFQRIRDRKAAGKLGDVVVIGIGTNGTVTTDHLVDILTLLKDRSRVVVILPKAPRPWIMQAVRSIKAAAAQFPGGNVRIADWRSFSSGNRDWFYADGIHTKPAGSLQMAALIRNTLRQ